MRRPLYTDSPRSKSEREQTLMNILAKVHIDNSLKERGTHLKEVEESPAWRKCLIARQDLMSQLDYSRRGIKRLIYRKAF